jgi:hypothetical protein
MVTATRRFETAASDRFGIPADDARVRRAIIALEANGFSVFRARDAAEARRIVLELIPEGTKVHHGASQSLEVTGITQELDTSGRYEPIGPRIRGMDRATQGDEIRRESAAPDVMLGSVHAVTETGSLLAASMSGSQLAPYVAGAGRVILVVARRRSWRTSRRVWDGSTTPSRSRTPDRWRHTASTAASTRS